VIDLLDFYLLWSTRDQARLVYYRSPKSGDDSSFHSVAFKKDPTKYKDPVTRTSAVSSSDVVLEACSTRIKPGYYRSPKSGTIFYSSFHSIIAFKKDPTKYKDPVTRTSAVSSSDVVLEAWSTRIKPG
jgi:YHS domain-containing protein